MLTIRKIRPALYRLMAMLFAMQMVVTGFCVLAPQAHAMPMVAHAMMQADMAGACADVASMHSHPVKHGHACAHCDQTDTLTPVQLDQDHTTPLLAMVAEYGRPALFSLSGVTGLSSLSRGPPRSASLLFTTTQRIRI
ncbi:hypothetical protein [Mariprofundus erugo]|uniref:hypothetical protein n=1 Tax=Mariprofundus erugo TaxID=2528639 RepID=UPI00138670CF|nr:hypothetical protein [Mariprofundus erugo]